MIQPRGIYTTLDDIFDTRFAFMMTLNPGIASMQYQKVWEDRSSDEAVCEHFGLSKEEWDQRWADRPADLYTKAIRSQVITLIHQIIHENDESPITSSNIPTYVLRINVHPYLVEESKRDALVGVLQTVLHPQLRVEWVNFDLKRLRPTWLVHHADYVIMYNWQDWVETHIQTEENISIQSVMFLVPLLLPRELDPDEAEEFNKMVKNGLNPMELAEAYMSPALTFRYQNRKYWDFPKNSFHLKTEEDKEGG